MLNYQLIASNISPLPINSTVQQAIHQMEMQEVQQLPVINNGLFVGTVHEDVLLNANESDLLSSLQIDFLPFCVEGDEHFLTAARLLATRHMVIAPVVNADKEYIGCILQQDLLARLTHLTGAAEAGALVVLETPPAQFSISEIARLVETNDAQIMQLNTSISEVNGSMQITLRINKAEVSDVVATFQRYDYRVLHYAGEEQFENELRRNYQHLMNFLEM
ncbi:MAG TPA: CBS domain-containing protein [Phnomibacter sp.]|nr:CBS domain-containing protein [Phnomibacter sp.]